MKVETKILDNQQAEIVAEFEPQELETAKRRSAKQLAKRVRIPGFRPGKAPYDMIERTVGEEAIVDAAVEILVNDHYAQMLTDAELTPYASGSLEEVVSLDPPTFRFSVPLNPEVVLGDYQEIRQDYEAPVVMDAEVEEVLLDLQNRQAVFEAVERSIEAGDQVVLTLSGQRSEAKEDQPTQIVPERQQTIDVLADGADSSDEWPFPGFSAQLIGLAAGDEKTLLTVYPEDYAFEDLRDVEAEFKLTVQEVKSRTLPEMNDEFAQFFGEEFPTIEALRDRIRQNMEAEATRKYESEYTETLLQKILEVSNVKFPALMLDREVDGLYNEMKSNIESRGMDMETYLKMRSMDEAAFREELRPPAEERLVRNLLLLEIAGKDDIQVSAPGDRAADLSAVGSDHPEYVGEGSPQAGQQRFHEHARQQCHQRRLHVSCS